MRTSTRWALNFAHAASLYLPMLLMGLLALGSWWLARSTPGAAALTQVAAPKHEADYFLQNFVSYSFDKKGALIGEIFGFQAQHFPDTDTLEIVNLQSRSYQQKHLITAQSQRALSNGDGSELQLLGKALVVREPLPIEASKLSKNGAEPIRISGEFLHIFDRSQKIISHQPVLLQKGQNQFSADRLEYQHISGQAELTGRVKAHFAPKP